jgi:ABC-2 type transport system permease protein
MIRIIARREIGDHLRSFRYLLLAVLSLVLIPLGTLSGARDYARRADAYQSAIRDQRQLLLGGSAAPRLHAYGWTPNEQDDALRAYRAPVPLSVWARGMDGLLPAYWQFAPRGLEAGPSLDDLTSYIGGLASIDLVFVTEVVLSLLAVLLSFDAICGEREAGTLRAILAYAVPRNDIVLGKFFGVMLTIAPCLLLGFALSLVVAAINGVPLSRIDALPRFALLLLGALCYLAVFVSMALVVSAKVRTAKTSLVAILVIWASTVFVVPRLTAMTATVLAPIEAEGLYHRRQQTVNASIAREREQMLVAAWRQGTGNAMVPEGEFPAVLRAAYDRVRIPRELALFQKRRSMLNELADNRRRGRAQRQTIFSSLSVLSPAATFESAAMDLAGTGARTAARWTDRTVAHQRRLESEAFDRVFGVEVFRPDMRLLVTWEPSYLDARGRPPQLEELPAFAMDDAYDRALAPQALARVGGLGLTAAALLALGCVLFQRYDVRC